MAVDLVAALCFATHPCRHVSEETIRHELRDGRCDRLAGDVSCGNPPC